MHSEGWLTLVVLLGKPLGDLQPDLAQGQAGGAVCRWGADPEPEVANRARGGTSGGVGAA